MTHTWHCYNQGLPLHCTSSLPSAPTAVPLLYDCAPSSMGPLFAVWHPLGLCQLAFAAQGAYAALERAQSLWTQATWTPAVGHAAQLIQRLCAPEHAPDSAPLKLFLRGTAFQVRVWRALLDVRRGQVVSYASLAASATAPGAARAVGSALARNPLVYIVPCHRVIRADGATGNYGGGTALKQTLLNWEAGRLPALMSPEPST